MFVNSKQPNNDSVLPQNSNDCGKLNAPRDNFSANVKSVKNKNRQYIPGTELYPSAKNEVVAFESQLKKAKDPSFISLHSQEAI